VEPRENLSVEEIALGDPQFWLRPFAEREGAFCTLRRERPVSFHAEPEVPEGLPFPRGPGFWSLVKHADILHASRNPELFCSGKGSNIGDLPPAFLEFFGSMINMDDPRHGRLRRIVSRGFTPRRIARAEVDVDRVARRIVDAVIEKGECDFVTEVAARLPLAIICDMMGIPESQYDFVFEKSNVILGAGDPEYVSDVKQIVPALLGAGAELAQLARELGRLREKSPTDDLTSALVNAEIDGERLDEADLGSFFVLLAVAGNETTRNAISHGLLALSQHPEQRAIWQADFEGVAPSAVEEIVRWATPVIHFRRTATRDTEIRGQRIREGEKVVLWYCSGNRDEEVFPHAYRFDVRRDPNLHVGFGGPGPHHCLGAHLARREITIMFREILRRMPDIEVVGAPAMLQSFFIHGIKHMTVRWTPDSARPAEG
jgi:cytochrome P450